MKKETDGHLNKCYKLMFQCHFSSVSFVKLGVLGSKLVLFRFDLTTDTKFEMAITFFR